MMLDTVNYASKNVMWSVKNLVPAIYVWFSLDILGRLSLICGDHRP